MTSQIRTACLAVAFVGMTAPAFAQTWTYESDYGARAYRPRAVYQEQYRPRVVYQERYVPRVYNTYAPGYNSYAYEPVVTAPAVTLAPTRRTVVSRTIIPQGRGRGPIVKERIVSETTGPRVVTRRPAAVDYAYRPTLDEAYAFAPWPAPRVVTRPLVVDYGSRVTDGYALAPVAQPIVTTVRPRYNNRLLVVDPVTGDVVSEVND